MDFTNRFRVTHFISSSFPRVGCSKHCFYLRVNALISRQFGIMVRMKGALLYCLPVPPTAIFHLLSSRFSEHRVLGYHAFR
jgi:hypothetical protein